MDNNPKGMASLPRRLAVTPALLVLWHPARRWKWADALGSRLIEWADPIMRNAPIPPSASHSQGGE